MMSRDKVYTQKHYTWKVYSTRNIWNFPTLSECIGLNRCPYIKDNRLNLESFDQSSQRLFDVLCTNWESTWQYWPSKKFNLQIRWFPMFCFQQNWRPAWTGINWHRVLKTIFDVRLPHFWEITSKEFREVSESAVILHFYLLMGVILVST